MKLMRSRSGFTLIELLVVVAIIGILARVGLGGFMFSLLKSRDVQRKSDLGVITKALEAYANDFGQYPADDDAGGMVACDGAACVWGDPMAATYNGQTVTYLAKLPADPDVDRDYYYEQNGQGYNLYAALENDKDSAYQASGLPAGCGGGGCNYQVTESGVVTP